MKIRSDVELVDFIASKKQYRKRELISLGHDLSNPRASNIPRFSRAAVVLAYAHWEGFVKEAARAYVALVSSKSRPLIMLSSNFQALACRQELLNAQLAKKKIAPHLKVVGALTVGVGRAVAIDADSAIDTESNLNSEVFFNICESIGIDRGREWSVHGPYMDDLFGNRCAIAHGEVFIPEHSYAQEVIETVIRWIDGFSSDIENAAVQQMYLADPPRLPA